MSEFSGWISSDYEFFICKLRSIIYCLESDIEKLEWKIEKLEKDSLPKQEE